MCASCMSAMLAARWDLKARLESEYGLTLQDMADYLHDPAEALPRIQEKAHRKE